jgi:hypothetical protein
MDVQIKDTLDITEEHLTEEEKDALRERLARGRQASSELPEVLGEN